MAYTLRDGRPTDKAGWAAKQADPTYTRLAADRVGEGLFVSTVWLGTAPSVFETRVFLDETQESVDAAGYATEAEARAGHAAMLAKWA